MTVLAEELTASIFALISGEPGLPPFAGVSQITYRFLTTGPTGTYQLSDYVDPPGAPQRFTDSSSLTAVRDASNVRGLTTDERAIVSEIFNYLGTVLNVQFVNITDQPGRTANIRFGAAPLPNAGGVSVRTSNTATPYVNDVYFALGAFAVQSTLADNPGFRSTVLHEIAHALGLKHSFFESSQASRGFVPERLSNTLYTQMAYDDTPLGDNNYIYPLTLQTLDIAALHQFMARRPILFIREITDIGL